MNRKRYTLTPLITRLNLISGICIAIDTVAYTLVEELQIDCINRTLGLKRIQLKQITDTSFFELFKYNLTLSLRGDIIYYKKNCKGGAAL